MTAGRSDVFGWPRRAALIAAAGAALAVVACSDTQTGPEGEAGPFVEPEPREQLAEIPPALDEALRCWGLTFSAYYLHELEPELAEGFPQVSMADQVAWHDEAVRRAHAADVTRWQFQEVREPFIVSDQLETAEGRAAALQPLRACLASIPADRTAPPELRED